MRLAIRLAYIGTAYYGWQLQAQGQSLRTVQGQLERALGVLAGESVRVHGSGRTDAGVHAEDQVCHCDFPDVKWGRLRDMRHSLNAILPDDIRIYAIIPVAADFHARFDAHVKTYRYQFWQDRGVVPPRLVPYVWRCGPLDTALIRQALPLFEGEHDFAFLANTGTERDSTVRTVTRIELDEVRVRAGLAPMITLDVTGPGFLKQMVRNMAGLLAEIGRGRLAPDCIPACMARGRRADVPASTAPAKGLTLMRIAYSRLPEEDSGQMSRQRPTADSTSMR